MRWGRARRLAHGPLWALLFVALLGGAQASAARGSVGGPVVTLHTDLFAGPPLMGLGVQWDPYDYFRPTQAEWDRTFQRLDAMHPGFMRIVEPASDYFAGYDPAHNPRYRWDAPHVVELRKMLSYAKSRGIAVVLGDWSDPLIGGDPRVPAEFLAQLHDVYGYTNIRYYNVINEPNDLAGACYFGCWTGMVAALSAEFRALGLSSWLKLVGPDNANSWDDTPGAQALDTTSGLDTDNPIGGDSWLTYTLHAIPGLVGAYDSHRYGTSWGVEAGVYEDQMRTRREQISNLDSPQKLYFGGEVGLAARQVSPFSALDGPRAAQLLAPLIDPSVPRVSAFVDSQPHIRDFAYGVWTADMAMQGINAGMAGASAWDLDDAMHVGGQYGSQNLKQWGFWNSLGGQDGYPGSDLKLRPWYYSWSILARSFPAGSHALVTPDSGVHGLRVAAAEIPSAGGYDLSFAVVNDADVPRSITLKVPSALDPLTLNRYDYFAGERSVDAAGFPVPALVLPGIQLSAGVTIRLPSRGLVVLTSLGSGTSTTVHDGARTLVDGLSDWRKVYSHSSSMTLAHRTPADFDDDRSRATAKGKRGGYVVYRAGPMTSFELKVYYQRRLHLRVYGSQGGNVWAPIALASTHPAPALGGGRWYLAEILPAGALPVGMNRLKITLGDNHTEISQVAIRAG